MSPVMQQTAPKVGQATHANMTEEELLNDLLNQEKKMISDYSNAVIETSCPNMRQVLINNMEQTMNDQYSVFDAMSRKGFYPIKDAQDQDVQQAKQQLGQLKNSMN